MITTEQCRIGLRVKWMSLDPTIPAERGTVLRSCGNRYVVAWDGDEDGEPWPVYDLNDVGSRIYPLKGA